MRYRCAVEKLRVLAEVCESVRNWPPEDPFLLKAYIFRAMLEPPDPYGERQVGDTRPDRAVAQDVLYEQGEEENRPNSPVATHSMIR